MFILFSCKLSFPVKMDRHDDIEIVTKLLGVFEKSLKDLITEGIIKSFNFSYEFNEERKKCANTQYMHCMNDNNSVRVVENIMKKMFLFKNEYLPSLSFDKYIDTDWGDPMDMSEETGLCVGAELGLDVANSNQPQRVVSEKMVHANSCVVYKQDHVTDGNRSDQAYSQADVHCSDLLSFGSKTQTGNVGLNTTLNQHYTMQNIEIQLTPSITSLTTSVCGGNDGLYTNLLRPVGLQPSGCENIAQPSIEGIGPVGLQTCDPIQPNIDLSTKFLEPAPETKVKEVENKWQKECFQQPLDNSENEHANNVQYVCKICNKVLLHKASYTDHMTRHTGEFKYDCEKCDKQFAFKWKLTDHMKVHCEPQYGCKFCDKKFTRRSSCTEHEATHNSISFYKCKECGQDFKCSKYLRRHEERHKNIKYTCNFCPKSYRTQKNLKIHLKRHNPVTRVYCTYPTCKNTNGFLTVEDLSVHWRGHCESYLCAMCGKEFNYKHNLLEHEQNVHQDSSQRKSLHSCNLCQITFKQKRKLDQHLKRHLQEPEYACNVCGKKFYRRDICNAHMILHTEQRRFSCAQCGKAFATKSNLKSHINKHYESKSIPCPLCPSTFKSKTSYVYHMKNHNGNFSYECSTCNKKFVRKCHYEDHLRSHNSIRPHICATCGKSYKELKHCRAHINRAHPNEFNLETLVASITPEDACVADILNEQNMVSLLPTNAVDTSHTLGISDQNIPMSAVGDGTQGMRQILPSNLLAGGGQSVQTMVNILTTELHETDKGVILTHL